MIEVDFVTLGEASERLDVAPPTLRHWSDALEELEVHYLNRNNRNERIYYQSDLRVFEFLRDLKKEHGRRTTTKDLSYMILDKAREGELSIRSRDDAPIPNQASNKTAELLGQEDIKRLMDSERVKQFMSIVVDETTKNIRDELSKEFEDKLKENNKEILESNQRIEAQMKEQKERDEEEAKRVAERDKLLMDNLEELKKKNRTWWEKLFAINK